MNRRNMLGIRLRGGAHHTAITVNSNLVTRITQTSRR
jgi:hypothetical protein